MCDTEQVSLCVTLNRSVCATLSRSVCATLILIVYRLILYSAWVVLAVCDTNSVQINPLQCMAVWWDADSVQINPLQCMGGVGCVRHQ